MKIIVMGTGDFAAPSFQKILEAGHQVPALVTMPVRTRRKDKIPLPRVRKIADAFDIPILEPENVNSPEGIEILKRVEADLLFICDYGKILLPEVIALFPLGGVNLHGSILPKFRGAAPINRAILAGETRLGVSLIHITPEVDAGPVIAIDSYEPDESALAPEIEDHLSRIGAELLVKMLPTIQKGEDRAIPQDDQEMTRAPKIRKEEGRVDWSKAVRTIRNQYRGLQPWPKTFCDWRKMDNPETNPVRLLIGPLEIASEFSEEKEVVNGTLGRDSSFGTVVAADRTNGILVRAGNGLIRIVSIQPAGKKEMSASQFLSGYRIKVGDRLE